MKHLHALKPTRGASGLEYAMLLGLIGGLGIIAVSSFAVDTRRALEAPAFALLSTVPGLASAPATSTPAAPGSATPAPQEPTPPADPVLLGHSFRLTGVWLPLDAPEFVINRPFIETTPETISLFAPVNDSRPQHPVYPVIVPGDDLGGSTLASAGWYSIDYNDSAAAAHRMMDALMFTVEERPGFVFLVPAPWSPEEEAAVQSGDVWNVSQMSWFSPEPGASLEMPTQFVGEPVYE